MPSLTDQELVAACLAGRESAYALLVERYTPRLHRIAARICRHPEDAEDAVQESLLQAVRAAETTRAPPAAASEAITTPKAVAKAANGRNARVKTPWRRPF